MKAELEVGRQKARDAEEKAEAKVREAEEERDAKIAEIEDELRAAETIRRKLHNQVQELKGELRPYLIEIICCVWIASSLPGNIRVFARVRPALRKLGNSTYNLQIRADVQRTSPTRQTHWQISTMATNDSNKRLVRVRSSLPPRPSRQQARKGSRSHSSLSTRWAA